jgi:type I restriction enzyme, S subunit
MSEWQDLNIGSICKKIIDYRGKTPEKVSFGTKLITSKVIKNNRILDDANFEYIRDDKYEEVMRRGKPELLDILFTTEAPLGEVALIKSEEKIAIAQRIILLRADQDKVIPHFLFYSLRGPIGYNRVQQKGTGTTVLGIKNPELKKVILPIPPLPTQQKIAKILSNYDDLIENNLKRIKLLEEFARLTYEEWFLRFRIDGKKLDIDLESGLPFGWEKRKLTDVIKLNPLTKAEKGVEHPFIPMGSLSETNMVITDIEKRIPKGGTKFKNLDTLLARITPCLENGKTGFVQCLKDNEVATGSTEFIVMRATEVISPYYIYLLARTDGFREIAIQSMSGSDGRQRVKVKVFEKILLNIPTKEILYKYHSNMKNVFDEIQVLINKNQLLKEARGILLPRLMTGMIDTDEMDIAV